MERDLLRAPAVVKPVIRAQETVAPTRPVEYWVEKAWWITALPLILLITVPILTLFTRTSITEWLANIGLKTVLQAIGISLKTTLISVGLILLLGTPVAYLMGRYRFRYKKVLDALIDLPLVLPPSVAGLALLVTLGRRGSIGGWLADLGIEIAFTSVAVVIAQVFIAAPFYVRSASIGFAAVDPEIEQAARIDGASRWQIFKFLIVPLSRVAMISGIMMSWARALGEFGATIMFAGNLPGRTQTMPTAIYLGFERDLDSALTLSVILILFSFISLLVIKILVALQKD
ncbi:MAG: molybdenum ABC transporter permease subunit [Anaerolineae bacterium UTCFX2]|jgi:molybdate transport system permease protein|nr:ABC transporter permease [Anaerolineales bacterium]OQY90369.1 MAG: molybdenum ABC transporter permease subunit [Anaerolineae bacterium UTCFX2]